jgi:hypothetical protein
MNWQYRESSETAGASTLLSTLIGETEFVTAGRLETNSLSVRVGADPIPQRIGDLCGKIIAEGDSSGNLWKGGVYADQEFIYEQVPTTVDYILQNGALYRTGGMIEMPSLVDPGFYVRDTNAPAGYQPPGTSNIWDNPQVSSCNEVEYIWPDMLRLKFPGERQSVEVLLDKRMWPADPERMYPPGIPGAPPIDHSGVGGAGGGQRFPSGGGPRYPSGGPIPRGKRK